MQVELLQLDSKLLILSLIQQHFPVIELQLPYWHIPRIVCMEYARRATAVQYNILTENLICLLNFQHFVTDMFSQQ